MSMSTPWWKRRAAFIAGFAGLLVIVGGGTTAAVYGFGSRSEPAPTTTATVTAAPTTVSATPTTEPPTTEPATATPSTSVSGGCGADDSDQKMPSESDPISVNGWLNVEGMGFPVSDTYGPVNRDGDVWTCFAHSPKGAVQAAAYITAITTVSTDARREYYANAPQALLTATPNKTNLTDFDLKGYAVKAYDENSAIVDVAMAVSYQGTTYPNSLRVTLIWDSGWKQDISQMGENPATLIPGYSGFLTWPQ